MRKIRSLALLLVVVMVLSMLPLQSMAAARGWNKDSKGWYFLGDNGRKVTNTWKKDSMGWCYLGADGYMATNRWIKDSVGWCYVGANGYCVTNQWMKDSVGWCYLDGEGSMVYNRWIKDSVGWCYVGANGYMVTNKWVADSKGWCYIGADGYAVTNTWKQDSVGWCYLDSEGSMTKNKWVHYYGHDYYLDGNGYMVYDRWMKLGDNQYYFHFNGILATDCWIGDYYVDENGVYVPDKGTGSDIPDDLTLTIGLPLNGMVDDYDTNAYTLWLEEQTGYNLEFIIFQSASADYRAQLSTMLATGDELPDILFNFNIGTGALEEYGDWGYFVDLAPYYANKTLSAEFWEAMDHLKTLDPDYHNYVLQELTADSGGMYAVPRLEYSGIDTMGYQAFINQTWLDVLGLEMPTNLNEFYDVLVAFRDRDPNGNGKKDELPLIGNSDVVDWIINMFVYSNETTYFNVGDNNQLYLPQTTDAYRQALIFINKLIDEDLMFSNVFSMSTKEVKSLMNPPEGEAHVLGIVVGNPTLIFAEGNSSVYHYAALPYWGYAARTAQLFNANTFITEDCEYPQAAFKLLMTMFSREGALRQRYGEYGFDYTDADYGSKNFLGQPAAIKVLNADAFTGMNNTCWHVIAATSLIEGELEVVQMENTDAWLAQKLSIMAGCYQNFKAAEQNNNPSGKNSLTDIFLSSEEQDAELEYKYDCLDTIQEAKVNFCVGMGMYDDPSDDAQWAAYLQELNKAGCETWREIRQGAYEKQYPDRIPN